MEGINQKEEASTKHEVEVKMEDTDLKEKKGGIKESRVHEKPNKEADIKEEIWNAVQDGDKMKLAELLEKSSPTDMTFQRRDKKNNAYNTLSMATDLGDIEIVRMLIGAGADVNMRNPMFRSTPIMEAAARGHTAIVELLIESGADVNATNTIGATALMRASFSGHIEVINTLVRAGADVKFANKFGETAADVARDEQIRILLMIS